MQMEKRTWSRSAGRVPVLLVLAVAAASAMRAADPAPADDPAVSPSVREVLSREGDAEAGERAYQSCAVCHLKDGGGRPDGTFPQLAGQHREVIVKQLVDIREGRRHNPIMEPFADALLDAQEIADVAAYIETLPVPVPAEPPQVASDLEGGRRLYERDCQGCHGARGEGDPERFVPMLAGQHEAYLLRQIRAIAGGRRDNAHPEMQRRVSRYTDAQLQAVVDFAARLPGPERAAAK
jgi:cytochrome c553